MFVLFRKENLQEHVLIVTCSLIYFMSGGGGANKQHVTTKNTAKLDRETEELKHDKIPLDLGKLIQQGRQSKGLSQKDLATVIQCSSDILIYICKMYCKTFIKD